MQKQLSKTIEGSLHRSRRLNLVKTSSNPPPRQGKPARPARPHQKSIFPGNDSAVEMSLCRRSGPRPAPNLSLSRRLDGQCPQQVSTLSKSHLPQQHFHKHQRIPVHLPLPRTTPRSPPPQARQHPVQSDSLSVALSFQINRRIPYLTGSRLQSLGSHIFVPWSLHPGLTHSGSHHIDHCHLSVAKPVCNQSSAFLDSAVEIVNPQVLE